MFIRFGARRDPIAAIGSGLCDDREEENSRDARAARRLSANVKGDLI
jgi:hypothetical protein